MTHETDGARSILRMHWKSGEGFGTLTIFVGNFSVRYQETMSCKQLTATLALVFFLGWTGCGPSNPLLGEWEMDSSQTSLGAATFARQSGFDRLTFEPERVVTGDVELSVHYIIEEDRVRVVRRDRDHEDVVELLANGLINVEIPPGISVVYRRAGPGAG